MWLKKTMAWRERKSEKAKRGVSDQYRNDSLEEVSGVAALAKKQ
jgi:hypothetical protein